MTDRKPIAATTAAQPLPVRIAEARDLVAKRVKTVENATRAIARADRSGDGDKIAKAKESLARAQKWLAGARSRLSALQAVAAKKRAGERLARSGARAAKSIEEKAPHVAKRWAEDRKKERKRIAARKKALEHRLRDNREPPPGLPKPPPITEDLTKPISHRFRPQTDEEIEAGRERAREIDAMIEAQQPAVPEAWTAEHVANRMVEAFETLGRLPMKTRPAGGGNGWPAYLHAFADLAAQAALPDPAPARIRLGVTEVEMARMDAALGWTANFLRNNPTAARAAGLWAFRKAIGKKNAFPKGAFPGVSKRTLWRLRGEALETIAKALKARGAPVE